MDNSLTVLAGRSNDTEGSTNVRNGYCRQEVEIEQLDGLLGARRAESSRVSCPSVRIDSHRQVEAQTANTVPVISRRRCP